MAIMTILLAKIHITFRTKEIVGQIQIRFLHIGTGELLKFAAVQINMK